MKACLRKESLMAKVSTHILMETATKEITRMVIGKATESGLKPKVSNTKDFGWLVKSLGMAQQSMQMAIVTKVNGWMTNFMVKALNISKMELC